MSNENSHIDIPKRFPLGNGQVLWFEQINKYMFAHHPADEIIERIAKGASKPSVISYCQSELDIPRSEASLIVEDFEAYWKYLIHESEGQINAPTPEMHEVTPDTPTQANLLRIAGKTFSLKYDSQVAYDLVHPKFSHLETESPQDISHHLNVLHKDGYFTLIVDGEKIETWPESKEHLMGGKVSMQILQKIYDKEEDQWMGVFHAAGISDGQKCLIFAGDSGNGKSTLSALLLAEGYDILSDDFLPILSQNSKVCRFPAAISIKKESYDLIGSRFKSISKAEEFNKPELNKTFRYLPTTRTDLSSVPCNGLIFVKYQKDSGLLLEELPREQAFQELVPDSWISGKPENAEQFVKWFNNLPCYRLIYSDNEQMIEAIDKLFKHELS